jgi:hypothetical protein
MTEHDRTKHDKIAPVAKKEIIFFIFKNKISIFIYFFIVVSWTKYCHVV